MKNAVLILFISLSLSIVWSSCKKTVNEPDSEPTNCNNSSFTDTLSINFKPTFIDEDLNGNITILGNNNGINAVVRYNAEGEFQWHKEYPNLQGREHGIVFIDETAFFIKTSTSHYEYEFYNHTYDQIWVEAGLMLDSNYNYINFFEIISNFQPQLQLPNTNTSYLTKISSVGDILWTKEFSGDYCKGNSLCRLNKNNFLFLTSEFYGPYYDMIDHEGVENDTVLYPFDRNKRTVYKLNDEGDIIWSTEISDIFETDKLKPDDNYFTFLPQDITQNGDNIIVNTYITTHQLNSEGQIMKSYQPHYDFQANHTMYMIKADENSNFFWGSAYTYDDYVNETYLMKFDVSQNKTIWKKEITQIPIQVSSISDQGFVTKTYRQNNYSVSKYNSNGDEVWVNNIETLESESIVSTIKASCNGGAIILISHYTYNNLVVIRTDKNGEF